MGGVEDRTGKDVAGGRVPGQQGQDHGRLEEERPHQEQEWQDRQQEGFREREAGVQAYLGLDEGRGEGAQAAQGEGFRGGEEGYRALQARQGDLRHQVRMRRNTGRDYVVCPPGRGWFRALSNSGLACLLRGPYLMYAPCCEI